MRLSAEKFNADFSIFECHECISSIIRCKSLVVFAEVHFNIENFTNFRLNLFIFKYLVNEKFRLT